MLSRPLLTFLLALFCCAPIGVCGQLVPPGTPAGKTQLAYDEEPFANFSEGDGGAGFVKFAIILSQPDTVYFQDSNLFPFHYEFATQHLAPFLGMSRAEFDAVSLRRTGQQVVLGAVIYPPFGGPREFGIQFVGLDAYAKEDVAAWFDVVRAAVLAKPSATAIYIPSYEQKAQTQVDRIWFAERGIEVDGIERWIRSDATYAAGWAFGRLVFVPGNEIAAAYSAGVLRPSDVLLTDGVPAEVPFLAGILTLSAATPNSHVAILARNQRVPFAWIASDRERIRIQALVGQEVLVRAATSGAPPLRVSAADPDLDPRVRAQILEHKMPPAVTIKARKPFGALSADVTNLTPRDVKFFGGKAANFGLLRRAIPENSPRALAFSFDLWAQYLENVNPDSGLTLRAEIDQRLGGFTWPPDFPAATAQLQAVREIIRQKIKFTDAQKAAILAALNGIGFESNRMLRFRSSSNAEDTEHLSGAGLYESFNGCIADSTDGNDDGPSHCCTDEVDERPVLRAIEKVFASFYNDNSWLERRRFGIPEAQAGMAVLVHANAPDADELANGVATIKRRGGGHTGTPRFGFFLVTQLGAVSVTNPEGGAKPEVISGSQTGARGEPFLFTHQHSDLVPLGGHVMSVESDYRALTRLLVKVAEGYARMFPEKGAFTLDLEFKKMVPGQLLVKQVREIVEPTANLITPILLNEAVELAVYQGESGDAFAYHRLKCLLGLETLNRRMNAEALTAPLHSGALFDFTLQGVRKQLLGGPFAWPGYRFTAPRPGIQTERWTVGNGPARQTFALRTSIPQQVDAVVSPVITQRDFSHRLSALYATPQPYLDWLEGPKTRTSDSTALIPRDALIPDRVVQTRRISTPGGVVIEPRFRWPDYEEGGGFIIIKTFPLARWEETTITGLTTQPLVLTDDFAQTYAPGHHNFSEVFLYEPALDPAVTPQQLQELAAANIRMIHVSYDRIDAVKVFGFDGKFRPLP